MAYGDSEPPSQNRPRKPRPWADREVARRKRRKREGQCVYCGKIGPVTDDHVPPQAIFPELARSGLIHVPCCAECNGSFSKDDEYFRSRLVLRFDVSESDAPVDSVLRGFFKPEKRGFRDAFERSLLVADIQSPGGIHLGTAPAYQVHLPRMRRVVSRIVKGLFFHELQCRLPDEYQSHGMTDSDWNSSNLPQEDHDRMAALHSRPVRSIGQGAFTYRFLHAGDDHNSTLWLLSFYENVWFLGATAPRGILPTSDA